MCVSTMLKDNKYYLVVNEVEIPVRFIELAIDSTTNRVHAIKLVLEAYHPKLGLIDAKNAVQFVDMAKKMYQHP